MVSSLGLFSLEKTCLLRTSCDLIRKFIRKFIRMLEAEEAERRTLLRLKSQFVHDLNSRKCDSIRDIDSRKCV